MTFYIRLFAQFNRHSAIKKELSYGKSFNETRSSDYFFYLLPFPVKYFPNSHLL